MYLEIKRESQLYRSQTLPVIPPSGDPHTSLVFHRNRLHLFGTFLRVVNYLGQIGSQCSLCLLTKHLRLLFLGTIVTLCSRAIPKPSVKFYLQLLGITVSRTVLYTMKPVKVSRHIGFFISST